MTRHGGIGDAYQADARLLHQAQGRWVSPDPAGLGAVDMTNPQSWNRYTYVLNNPLSNTDPSGLLGSQTPPPQSWTPGPVFPCITSGWSYGMGSSPCNDLLGGLVQIPGLVYHATGFAWVGSGGGGSTSTGSGTPSKNCVNAPGQPIIDFVAGAGDTLSFGLTNLIRDQMGTNDFVNHNSGSYTAGQAGGVALSVGIGGAAGAEAATANAGKAGFEFSHWIPARMGGPRSVFNGNYVSQAFHYLTDPFRYPSGWRALRPKLNPALQQLLRIPWIYHGAAGGAAYGGASVAVKKSSGC